MIEIQRGIDGKSIIIYTDSTRTVVSSSEISNLRRQLEHYERELGIKKKTIQELRKQFILDK